MKILRTAILVMPLLLASCSVVKPTAAVTSQPQSKDAFSAYIAKYNGLKSKSFKRMPVGFKVKVPELANK